VCRTSGGGDDVLLNPSALIGRRERTYIDATAEAGSTRTYRLAAVLDDATERRSHEVTVTAATLKTSLWQNVPNPFNPETTIEFALASPQTIELSVYDVRGTRVATLVSGPRPEGPQSVSWNGTDERGNRVASGVYVYRLTTNQGTFSRKMVLAR
jgi:hypothetical protein